MKTRQLKNLFFIYTRNFGTSINETFQVRDDIVKPVTNPDHGGVNMCNVLQ